MKATRENQRDGFTLVEIMIVVAIIALLATIAIPNFIEARDKSHATACINNLQHLDDAANQWALERGKQTGDAIDLEVDLAPYIKLNANGKIPKCPANGTYVLDAVGDTPTCSLSTFTPPHVLP